MIRQPLHLLEVMNSRKVKRVEPHLPFSCGVSNLRHQRSELPRVPKRIDLPRSRWLAVEETGNLLETQCGLIDDLGVEGGGLIVLHPACPDYLNLT